MEVKEKSKKRELIKTIAIVFLAVLLVLTFFSNTIMNRSLAEVSTTLVTSGTINARIRGSGTVSANESYEVVLDQTREVRSVCVKVGDTVNQGDLLFVLGDVESQELKDAQEQLQTLNINYQKQLLAIQVSRDLKSPEALTASLFSDDYLLERPLLRSIRLEKPVVLLIDEIDKADEEFEAFLLELLSEMQVTIPEVGTIRAKTIPFVVLTSNRTRPLSEALRRRCAYLYIQYPSLEKEVSIIRAKLPNVNEHLALQVAQAIHDLRENQAILKKPSIAETLDWVAALEALGISDLTGEAMDQTKGFVLKNSEDLEALSGGGRCGEGGHCGHCHSEAAPEAPDDTDKIARAQDRPTLKVPRTL